MAEDVTALSVAVPLCDSRAVAKCNFAGRGIPKFNLGTREGEESANFLHPIIWYLSSFTLRSGISMSNQPPIDVIQRIKEIISEGWRG